MKPVIKVDRTNATYGTTSTTYNSPITYNDSSQIYGGGIGYSDYPATSILTDSKYSAPSLMVSDSLNTSITTDSEIATPSIIIGEVDKPKISSVSII